MSAAKMQKTCAACGRPFSEEDNFEVEPVIETDQPLRFVAVHSGEHIYRQVQGES